MHLLSQFKYCPKCGSHRFEENNFKSKKCKDCNFTYYFNSSAATVAVILNKRGELLVATRAFEPAKGTLDLPGGFVDTEETAEEGVIREVKEETGLIIKEVSYLFSIPNIYKYSGFQVHTVDLFFLCIPADDDWMMIAHDDVSELQFVEISALDPNQFGLASIKKGLQLLITSGKLMNKTLNN